MTSKAPQAGDFRRELAFIFFFTLAVGMAVDILAWVWFIALPRVI